MMIILNHSRPQQFCEYCFSKYLRGDPNPIPIKGNDFLLMCDIITLRL